MFIPFFSQFTNIHKLSPRKGGGGGGHGGGGGGRASGGGGARGSTGSVTSHSGSVPKGSPNLSTAPHTSMPIITGGQTLKAGAFNNGGGPVHLIGPQLPFAGRMAGGGTRSQVYGNSAYGSGYPNTPGRGVSGRGFPFMFYPIVFAAPVGAGAFYLYAEIEYGKADNSSRPGGPLQQISISSNISMFHVIADNATVSYLRSAIPTTCKDTTIFNVSLPISYNSSQPVYPKPEEAIQYYRASSVVLTLDGYNNSAALSLDPRTPPTPLPPNIDTNLMTCINQTIGTSVPLVGSAQHLGVPPGALFMLLAWIIWNTL